MQGQSLFIFGLGYSTTGLARKAQAENWMVTLTCRSMARFATLNSPQHRILEFDPAGGKLLNDDGLLALHKSQYVISSIPPVAAKLYDPVLRAQHSVLRDVAAQPGCSLQALAYLSSTGVYGDWCGDWVDESFEPRTATARGILRLEAEVAWATLANQLQIPLTIFRLGGIYGPMRSVLHNLQQELDTPSSSSSAARRSRQRYTSRCHVADVVAAVQADMRRRVNNTDTRHVLHPDQSGGAEDSQRQRQQQQQRSQQTALQSHFVDIINVVDDEPASRGDVEVFARQLLGHVVSGQHSTHSASSEPWAQLDEHTSLSGQQQPEDSSKQSPGVGESQQADSRQPQQQQHGSKQRRSMSEPLEEKRVRNDKLKAVLHVKLLASTYREGLSVVHAGSIEPFAPEDLGCLYGLTSCMAQP